MDLLLLGLIAIAALDGDSKSDKKNNKSNKKSRRRKSKKDDSWLDAAWFHDHNQNL